MTTQASTHHHSHWLPESRVGQRSVALAGFSVGAVLLEVLAFAIGLVEPAGRYSDSWVQAVWGVAIWVSAVAALVTGVIAILRRHDHSWLVKGASLLGLLPVALLIWEIALGKF